MKMEALIVCAVLIAGVVLSITKRKLTVAGGLGGGAIGLAVYFGVGIIGLLLLGCFFCLGTAATMWQASQKEPLFLESSDKRRHLGQVLANGGLAGVLGLVALLSPAYAPLAGLMIAGAFSAATADTLSSELGTLWGKNFYHILTLKKDKRGLDGVVSAEGFIIGLAGSVVIAALYCAGYGWNANFWWIVAGGNVGNLADSVLGATLERRGVLKNDAVNF